MDETLSRIADSGVVAVLRGVEADQLIGIADALREGGASARRGRKRPRPSAQF